MTNREDTRAKVRLVKKAERNPLTRRFSTKGRIRSHRDFIINFPESGDQQRPTRARAKPHQIS
jgi:hypothetical protein